MHQKHNMHRSIFCGHHYCGWCPSGCLADRIAFPHSIRTTKSRLTMVAALHTHCTCMNHLTNRKHHICIKNITCTDQFFAVTTIAADVPRDAWLTVSHFHTVLGQQNISRCTFWIDMLIKNTTAYVLFCMPSNFYLTEYYIIFINKVFIAIHLETFLFHCQRKVTLRVYHRDATKFTKVIPQLHSHYTIVRHGSSKQSLDITLVPCHVTGNHSTYYSGDQ